MIQLHGIGPILQKNDSAFNAFNFKDVLNTPLLFQKMLLLDLQDRINHFVFQNLRLGLGLCLGLSLGVTSAESGLLCDKLCWVLPVLDVCALSSPQHRLFAA